MKPPGQASNIYGVAATGPTDVWAAGAVYPGASDSHSQALIEHWDGRRWQIIPTPPQHTQATVLHDIAAEAGEVVGRRWNRQPARRRLPAADARRALGWSPLEVAADSEPRAARRTGCSALPIAAPNSVWTFGQLDTGPAFVERWNGSSWSVHRFSGLRVRRRRRCDPHNPARRRLDRRALRTRPRPTGHRPLRTLERPDMEGNRRAEAAIWRDPTFRPWLRVCRTTFGRSGASPAGRSPCPASQPLIEHWDGHHWSLATGPHFKSPPPVGEPDPIIAHQTMAETLGDAADPNRAFTNGRPPTDARRSNHQG